jgi:hypothetical protein
VNLINHSKDWDANDINKVLLTSTFTFMKGKKNHMLNEFLKANDIIRIMLISILNKDLISLPDYRKLMISAR